MDDALAVAVLCIACGGVAAQWAAWRFKLPAIVLLFAVGLVVGPGLQLLHPSAQFGAALRPLIGLAVAIIVFEGGLALDLRELRAAGEGVLRLTAVALPLNLVLGTVAAHWIGGMGWGPATLFGAITVVTGPTVVLPLLRHTRLERRAGTFLKWEAILNDPIGAILAAGVLEVLVSGSRHGTHASALVSTLAPEVLGGAALAVGLGLGLAWLVRLAFDRDQVPEMLKTPVLLALAMATYATCNLVIDGAGLLSATVFGVGLANMRLAGLAELRRFKLALVVLLVSALFVTLTADLDRHTLSQLSWPVMALTAVMLVVVRPASILLATWRSDLSWQERALPAWIAPRGIVAAAIAGVSGLQLGQAGYPGAALVMPSVFTLIAATMVLHGFSLGPLARRLKLALGSAPGLAIVGASGWSTDLAAVLHGLGVPVLLIDTFPGALDPARRLGLPTLQAELVSDQGEEELGGRAVDYLLAATPDDIYNGLVCTRIMPELGRRRVFQVAPPGRHVDERRGVSRDLRGQVLGTQGLDFATCEARHAAGWRFGAVEASVLGAGQVGLVIVRADGGLHLVSGEGATAAAPQEGDHVVVFERPAEPAGEGAADARLASSRPVPRSGPAGAPVGAGQAVPEEAVGTA